jgi:hypothetical protein
MVLQGAGFSPSLEENDAIFPAVYDGLSQKTYKKMFI